MRSTTLRRIRQTVPPRPEVLTLAYLDKLGRPCKGVKSNLSLIRTRDNMFYLQRILPDGEVIRWRCLGLENMKQATSFESYSIHAIDANGGVIIPTNVRATSQSEPLGFLDAVTDIRHLQTAPKFTRQDRREEHRQLFSHWSESPEKYSLQIFQAYVVPLMVLTWLLVRGFNAYRNNKGFWAVDVYDSDDPLVQRKRIDIQQRAMQFDEKHPEHGVLERGVIAMSPAQERMMLARSELRGTDAMDPHMTNEIVWKMRHAWYYGHWPKGLLE